MMKDIHKWHIRYLELAQHIAGWSKDPSRGIGAIAVGDKGQILAQGYNGFPRGIADEPERLNTREIKYEYMVHAEQNMIYNACLNGVSLNGSKVYVWGLPVCHECAKALIQCGVKEVYMASVDDSGWQVSCGKGIELFLEAKVYWDIIKLPDA